MNGVRVTSHGAGQRDTPPESFSFDDFLSESVSSDDTLSESVLSDDFLSESVSSDVNVNCMTPDVVFPET